VSAFGPTPIPPVPGAVQASIIAQQAAPPRPREKGKPREVDAPRGLIRDEVRLSDPSEAQPVDGKPDAVEEWKQKPREHPRREGEGRLDVRG